MGGGVSRDGRVRRVLLIEGAANAAVLVAKATAGLATGSLAILGDAVHSLADLCNNGLAYTASRLASEPPDRDHPYGHRKFETLAVFGLAMLLAVLAVELATRGLAPADREVARHGWSLALMLGVLATNTAVATWEARRARQLDSDLLRADARHTLSDALITSVVIVGWQLAADGHAWLDGLASLLVAGLILALAYGLFRRSIPILVDHAAADPDRVTALLRQVAGVRATHRVRSLRSGVGPRIDVAVGVDPELSTRESHAIADAVERSLRERLGAEDVVVHVEPHPLSRTHEEKPT